MKNKIRDFLVYLGFYRKPNLVRIQRKVAGLFGKSNINLDQESKEIFKEIYKKNLWGSSESVSGSGSELKRTQKIRNDIKSLISKYKISSILDVPCGDFNWMKEIDMAGIEYLGIDIVPELILANTEKFSTPSIKFLEGNLITDKLNKADLVICRDCLVHLSNEEAITALNNIKKSNSMFLLTTSYKNPSNTNIKTGEWRPVNLNIAPFNLPKPLETYNEIHSEDFVKDKSLILIEISQM